METTVGGRVTGLASGNIVELELLVRGAHLLFDNVDADGKFTFGKSLNAGDKYDVVVATQPNGQTCTVANGSGYINSEADSVTNVVVTCSAVSGRFVYTTLEAAGKVAGYAIDSATGALTAVGSPVASGAYPKGVAVDPSGKFAYVTSEVDNVVSVYTINATTGALTYASQTATNAGPIGVVVDPAGRFVYISEAGAYKISSYSIDSRTGGLTFAHSFTSSPANYPHIALSPSGDVLYGVAGYEGRAVSVNVNRLSGELKEATPWNGIQESTNQVAVHPSGRFAYITVGEYGMSGYVEVFSTNAAGALNLIGNVTVSNGILKAIAIDPTGKFAYVTDTANNVVYAYAIDGTTGSLSVIGTPVATGQSPVGITITGSGKYVYVANASDDSISTFSINATTGALRFVTSTVSTGQPEAITNF